MEITVLKQWIVVVGCYFCEAQKWLAFLSLRYIFKYVHFSNTSKWHYLFWGKHGSYI